MAKLTLNLKGIYFKDIASGDKPEEFRLRNPFWQKRLEGKTFDEIVIRHGYPKKGNCERELRRPWRGYKIRTITHPHFGQDPVEVFAIRVN